MLMKGKVALVAGIGPGLGRESALVLAREGADLILAARSSQLIEELATEIEQLGRQALWQPTDITSAKACENLVANARERFGRIDVLVNNAFYTGELGSIMETDLDDWRQVMEVNLLGAVATTRAVVPAMEGKGGSIIMVNSLQAWGVVPGFGAYSASKAALESVTRAFASELGPRGIRVNGMHPGMILEEKLMRYFETVAEQKGCTPEEAYQESAAEAAMRYIPNAKEIAGTVLYLASDLAKPVTGQSIGVNAGAWFH